MDTTNHDDNSRVPDFITRVDLSEMSDEALDDLIQGLRERRMASYIIYRQTVEDIEAALASKARDKLDLKLTQTERALGTLDKQLERLEKLVHEIRGLRIQANLSVL